MKYTNRRGILKGAFATSLVGLLGCGDFLKTDFVNIISIKNLYSHKLNSRYP